MGNRVLNIFNTSLSSDIFPVMEIVNGNSCSQETRSIIMRERFLRIMFNDNAYLFIFKLKQNLLPHYICDKLKMFRDVEMYIITIRDIVSTDFVLVNTCNM